LPSTASQAGFETHSRGDREAGRDPAHDRAPDVVATNAVAGKTGGRMAVLGGGFAGVMLARPRTDGTYETRCVFSFEEGAEFLGLVAENTQTQ
jgi:hypothetical protein